MNTVRPSFILTYNVDKYTCNSWTQYTDQEVSGR